MAGAKKLAGKFKDEFEKSVSEFFKSKKKVPGKKKKKAKKKESKRSKIRKGVQTEVAESEARRIKVESDAEAAFLKEVREGKNDPSTPASDRLLQLEDEIRARPKKKSPGRKKKK